nr:MAG TPA: Picornavirus 2B protein [Caudoviricetes sp.]
MDSLELLQVKIYSVSTSMNISSSNPLLEFPQVLFANPFEWLKRSLSTMSHKPPQKNRLGIEIAYSKR